MKRFLSLVLAMVFICLSSDIQVMATQQVSHEQVIAYTLDYVENIGMERCQKINGLPHINLHELAPLLCSEAKFDSETKTLTFTYGPHSGSVTVGKKTAYLDGNAVKLSVAPVMFGNQMYATATSVGKLFDRKVYINTRTAGITLFDLNSQLKRGTPVHYYHLAYNPGSTSYSSDQLTFMQGLSAPIMLHNIQKGMTDLGYFDEKDIELYLYSMRPLTGLYPLPNSHKSFKNGMESAFGITTRKELINTIKSLLENGISSDKSLAAYDNSRAVQLSQMGFLVGWLTAEETITYGMKAAKQAQQMFSSWSDFGSYYMKGARKIIPPTGLYGAEIRQKLVDYLYSGNAYQGISWDLSLA